LTTLCAGFAAASALLPFADRNFGRRMGLRLFMPALKDIDLEQIVNYDP
jgi:hypothetical protein